MYSKPFVLYATCKTGARKEVKQLSPCVHLKVKPNNNIHSGNKRPKKIVLQWSFLLSCKTRLQRHSCVFSRPMWGHHIFSSWPCSFPSHWLDPSGFVVTSSSVTSQGASTENTCGWGRSSSQACTCVCTRRVPLPSERRRGHDVH